MPLNLLRTASSHVRRALRQLRLEAQARAGTAREREGLGLLARPGYAYGMFRAADLARFLGRTSVTICEFGVATGNGLMAMVELAALIGPETGIEFRIVGFDTGAGLPALGGPEDHPEIWSPGDFQMGDREALLRRIDGRAELRFGDIKDTVAQFLADLRAESPLGFVSIDVDIYSATVSALRCLDGAADLYLPAISMYFDDVAFFFANRWCGELRAIEEFNQAHASRKIDSDRSIWRRGGRSYEPWFHHMYVAHVLDHEVRSRSQPRQGMDLNEHLGYMRKFNIS